MILPELVLRIKVERPLLLLGMSSTAGSTLCIHRIIQLHSVQG